MNRQSRFSICFFETFDIASKQIQTDGSDRFLMVPLVASTMPKFQALGSLLQHFSTIRKEAIANSARILCQTLFADILLRHSCGTFLSNTIWRRSSETYKTFWATRARLFESTLLRHSFENFCKDSWVLRHVLKTIWQLHFTNFYNLLSCSCGAPS